MYMDKVYTGVDHAPPGFDLRGRILGPNGNNLEYIKNETGAAVTLQGGRDSGEPLHVVIQHSRTDKMTDARNLILNLIETVKNDLQQFVTQAETPVVPGQATLATPVPQPNIQEINIAPAIQGGNTPVANSPVVAVRPQTVLQLMPQQQYILNQDGSQLIPLIQQGIPMSAHSNFTQLTTLPLAQGYPQTSIGGTQFVDANLQPVSMGHFRLTSIPNSMQTYIQNGIAFSQVSLANQDTTTVSYTSLLPVSSTVSSPSTGLTAAQSTQQKVQGDKTQYQLQTGEQLQGAPSQTMYIPYQQLQDITGGQNGATLHPQLVSISAGGNINTWPASSMSLPHITQLAPGTTLNPNILQLNQKPPASNASVINLWSAQGSTSLPTQIAPAPQIITPTGHVISGQPMQISASQGTTLTPIASGQQWVRPPIAAALSQGAELIPLNTTLKLNMQDSRGQKRLSDGTPSNQIQLRPIAPAGSHTSSADKSGNSRDVRWTGSSARDGSFSSSNKQSSRISISTNTSSSQTSRAIPPRDNTSSPARQGEKRIEQDAKHESTIKPQPLPNNIQMYALSHNSQGMQNLTGIPTTAPSLTQTGGQWHIVPSSPTSLQALPPGAVVGQHLPMGQGIIQPNQLSLPQGVQYNTVPLMHLPQNMQYLSPGISLNNPGAAQQLGLIPGQQLISPAMLASLQNNSNLAPINQSIQPMPGQVIPVSQAGSVQYGANQLPSQQQFIGSQSEVTNAPAAYANQFATHQGNIIIPSQQNLPQQYTSVSQQIPATAQVNPSEANGVNGTANDGPTPQGFPGGVTQQFAPIASVAQPINQQYPHAGSPTVAQIPRDPSPQPPNFTPETYPTAQTPGYQGQGAPPGNYVNGRQWQGQRFPPPLGHVAQQFGTPSTRGPPPAQTPPSPAQTANNSNYWQYT